MLQPNLWSIYFADSESVMDHGIKDVHKVTPDLLVDPSGLVTESVGNGDESGQVSSELDYSKLIFDQDSSGSKINSHPTSVCHDPRTERAWAFDDCTDAPPPK